MRLLSHEITGDHISSHLDRSTMFANLPCDLPSISRHGAVALRHASSAPATATTNRPSSRASVVAMLYSVMTCDACHMRPIPMACRWVWSADVPIDPGLTTRVVFTSIPPTTLSCPPRDRDLS